MIAEMIHSASLIHDDVIDQSDFRRGKPSVNALWSHKKVGQALLLIKLKTTYPTCTEVLEKCFTFCYGKSRNILFHINT